MERFSWVRTANPNFARPYHGVVGMTARTMMAAGYGVLAGRAALNYLALPQNTDKTELRRNVKAELAGGRRGNWKYAG